MKTFKIILLSLLFTLILISGISLLMYKVEHKPLLDCYYITSIIVSGLVLFITILVIILRYIIILLTE